MPVVSANARPLQSSGAGFLGVLLGLYVLAHTAPIAEILDTFFHINFGEIVILGGIITVGAILTGRFGRFSSLPVGKCWVALGICFLLASVLGIYRRQSVPFMLQYLIRFHTFPFLICALASTAKDVRRLLFWAALGWLTILVLCLIKGDYQDGRFVVLGTSLANPNDLSLLLLLSAVYGLAFLFSRNIGLKVVWAVAVVLTVYFVMSTGSRANFLTFLVAVGSAVLILPGRIKIAIAICALIGAITLSFFIPSSTWDRLTMISSNPEEDFLEHPELAHELGSQLARVELQRRAYRLALNHPLLGVGPLMFADAADKMVREETGRKTLWQDAHDVYLQIAAENGIPALIFYIACFYMCWQMNYRSFKYSLGVGSFLGARSQSFCLALATVVLGFGILFCNFVYEALWPILLGLSAANYLAMKEVARSSSAIGPAARPLAGTY